MGNYIYSQQGNQAIVRRYGWKRGHPTLNDAKHIPNPAVVKALPPMMDLRSKCPNVYTQGELGSCVANAMAGAVQYDLMLRCCGAAAPMPSRLFIYYNARLRDGTSQVDSGTTIHDGVATLTTQGVCPEDEWPYLISKFSTAPPKTCYDDALKCKVSTAKWVNQDEKSLCAALAGGVPVACGIVAYASFESPGTTATGRVTMPQPTEDVLGGHAILLVGYNNTTRMFTFRNSWGTTWGESGYGYIPYDYILNPVLAAEFVTLDALKTEDDTVARTSAVVAPPAVVSAPAPSSLPSTGLAPVAVPVPVAIRTTVSVPAVVPGVASSAVATAISKAGKK